MVTANNGGDGRPVWFVTGGNRWDTYIDNGYWRCYPATHKHDAPAIDVVSSMLPGDRIAIKFEEFRNYGRSPSGEPIPSVGIWATGLITHNNLPDRPSVEVNWRWIAGGARDVRNCPTELVGFGATQCVWKVEPGTKGCDEFITTAFGMPPETVEVTESSDDAYTIDNIIAAGCFLDRPRLETMLQRLSDKRNIILQGPPGTGKTWLAKRLAYALVGYKDDDRVRPLQFHPNMSYEDFVRGWRPAGDGRLELVDGPLLRMIDDAKQNPDARYVMVIEEINRGNPAQIFGEMLTLLESDKRNPGEAMALAYPRTDGERVHIPPNVYVIGTMNIADRSLALVDFALRRRFAFFDLEPTLGSVWRNWVSDNCGIPDAFLADVERRLTALNNQIAADPTLGPQFRIGHSVVTPPPGADIPNPQEWFKQAVATEIAPLLREYYFDNPKAADDAQSALLDGLPQ